MPARAAWMGVLARAKPADLAAAFEDLRDLPCHRVIRPPQTGLVMARGRAGATGDAFNIGEVAVTRCAVELPDGVQGHAYVAGRDRDHALQAAVCDALMQTDRAEFVRSAVLLRLEQAESARRAVQARKAAATRVEFFTLVRGG
jgi:alpha-D-ribose 1-methylphosphonate 5-triphosphate synthase subunit PhnG